MTPIALRAALVSAFSARPPRGCVDERDLCDVLGRELAAIAKPLDLALSRERILDAASRLDFYVADGPILGQTGIAVEVKVGGSVSALLRQLHRYADHPTVSGLLVVTTRGTHRAIPDTIGGKPVACVWVGEFLL